jgi:hypothetical protein
MHLSDYSEITLNLSNTIDDEIEENFGDGNANAKDDIRREAIDNLVSVFYMDECGQVWVCGSSEMRYVTKFRL